MNSRNLIHYICCEPMREGHAAYTHVYEISNELKKLGWQVSLHIPSYSMHQTLPSLPRRLIKIAQFIFNLIINFPKTGIIYIRWHWAASIIAFIAHLRKLPIIIEVNGTYLDLFLAWPFTKKIDWIFKKLYNIQLKYAHSIISVTPKLAEFIQKIHPEKDIHIISNAANIELFHPQIKNQENLQNPYAIFFGSFTKWHGISYLLKATKSIYWPCEVKLLFLGDGTGRKAIEQEARSNSRVVYKGVLPYNEVSKVIAQAIIGVAYSTNLKNRSDMGLSPLKLYEMLACGLPVIAPDHPDLGNIITSENCGLMVPEDDAGELAKAVFNLWNNPQLRDIMAINARNFAIYKGSWRSRAKKLDQILKNL